MNQETDSLSVLIIDEQPDVLAFFAQILEANNIRALLARSSGEAMDLAKRTYLPIDLVLANVLLPDDPLLPELTSPTHLVESIRLLRPEARVLYMSAGLESGVIRMELHGCGQLGLIDAIRNAAAGQSGQRVRSMGGH